MKSPSERVANCWHRAASYWLAQKQAMDGQSKRMKFVLILLFLQRTIIFHKVHLCKWNKEKFIKMFLS